MAKHGKDTYIEIDNASGVLTSVQAYLRSTSSSESIDTAETTNFGQNAKTYVVGMSDETISLGGTFDVTFLTLLRAIKAALQAGTLATCSVRIGWSGNASALEYEERETILTSINVSSSTSDVVTLTCDFQRTGDTTVGTYA